MSVVYSCDLCGKAIDTDELKFQDGSVPPDSFRVSLVSNSHSQSLFGLRHPCRECTNSMLAAVRDASDLIRLRSTNLKPLPVEHPCDS